METPEDFAFVRKYLDRILIAETTDVLMIHMIHFIRLIRKYEIPFDFGLLAYDLFLFQIDEYKLSAKLAWEMDFMSTGYKDVEKEENTETADKPKKRKSKRLAAPEKEEN